MAEPSRMDRYVKLIGGDLPPKKGTTPTIPVHVTDQVNEAQSGEAANTHETVEWWDQSPDLEATPARPGETSQLPPSTMSTSAQTAANPATSYSSSGITHYDFDPRKGQPGPVGAKYCPFVAVTKYPYKFARGDLRQPLATAFFDEGKIWNREWDLYYVWSDHFPTSKPVLFITEVQLQRLLDDINRQFPKANLKITDEQREEGLVINFDDINLTHLRPFVLGHSSSRVQIDDWTDRLPLPQPVPAIMTDRTHEAFRAKIELAHEVAKTKSKAKKKQRQDENVVKRRGMAGEFIRTQRYLGLTPTPPSEVSLDEHLASLSVSVSIPAIDTTNVVPYPLDQDIIFIAVDVEAYEHPPRQVTEVGIATLDTRDIKLKAPGPVGEGWQSVIRARHIRVAEYKNLINKDFVAGCPNKFEFGESEFVGQDQLPQTVASCFKAPYSVPGQPDGGEEVENRKIVFVGHDVLQDIDYLYKIGYNPYNSSHLLDTVDTAALFRVATKDPNARALGSILYEYGLTGWNAHNAGNDAVHTLWAMLAICVRNSSERESEKAASEMEEKEKQRTEAAVAAAKEKVKDDMEGWDAGEEGGVVLTQEKPTFGPVRPGEKVYYTSGGAILDV